MPKMIGYVQTFKIEDRNNKLMSFHIKHIKLFKLRLKIFKKNELNALPVYDDRYIKTKIITFGDKVYTNIHDLNVPENLLRISYSHL